MQLEPLILADGNAANVRDLEAATSSKIAINRATCTSNVCSWPSRKLAPTSLAGVVVGHVVESGDQLVVRVGRSQDVAVAPSVKSSLAPFWAVVITGRPQASASSTTSEHGS